MLCALLFFLNENESSVVSQKIPIFARGHFCDIICCPMKKILIVDDQSYILESTSLLLRFEDYDVATAANGRIGVEVAKQYRPDLILCDISMPELDGYGVLEAIRSDPLLSSTPFVFLTARTDKADMRAGMVKGADDFLIKPYTRDDLIQTVNSIWKKRSNLEVQSQKRVEDIARNITYALPHEFRIVLNQVMGSAKYLQTIAHTVTPSGIEEMTDDILVSARRLIRITENFLTYAQIESFMADPAMRATVRSFRTDEPAAMLCDLGMAKAMNFNRAADVNFGELIEGLTIEVSSENFAKIIAELVDNALRFSDPGAQIVLDMFETERGFVGFRIADRGRGMTAEQITDIGAYKQFERTTYEQQGVGLGLYIAKKLTELHNGTFNIESKEGAGTTITFTLPIVMSE